MAQSNAKKKSGKRSTSKTSTRKVPARKTKTSATKKPTAPARRKTVALTAAKVKAPVRSVKSKKPAPKRSVKAPAVKAAAAKKPVVKPVVKTPVVKVETAKVATVKKQTVAAAAPVAKVVPVAAVVKPKPETTFVAPPASTASPVAALKAPPAASAPKPVEIRPVIKAAPIEPVRVPAATPKLAPPDIESAAVKVTPKKPGERHGFKINESIVYPTHGVGQIVAIEEQEVAGFRLELFVINFVKDKMTLRVPLAKVLAVGMRKLSDAAAVKRALEILCGRARIKRTMWSRRAQEYEAKINSGDINAISEVVRDLHRSDLQPEQSYSERQLYEAALDRIVREIAAVNKTSELEAQKLIELQLSKGPKRLAKTDGVSGEGEIEQAA